MSTLRISAVVSPGSGGAPSRLVNLDWRRSASTATTRCPAWAKASARLAVMVLLPSPGSAEVTRIEPLKNAAAELANLRPIYSSFANAPHTQRVFELIRLLSRARLYALWPGHPDEAARAIEEVVQ